MRKTEAEAVLESWMKPVLGFALKRCRTAEDAEDLSQEIILKVYRKLLLCDDVEDVERYIWTVAHNALCNYYRSTARNAVGISIEEIGEIPAALAEETDDAETVDRLKKEIAYLSETQRKIVVAYYIDRKKQEQIAREVGIPVGTVKWHLFQAKKELKKGMEIMRENGDLKYNPVKFTGYGINGSFGEKDIFDTFRSPLIQNICYCVRDTWKTVNEIADDLGVSPVYVSGETTFLEEYGFLKKKADRYLADMLIDIPDMELQQMESSLYRTATELFVNELYEKVENSGVLESPALTCAWKNDRNFLLWALIPWIAASSGGSMRERNIAFEEAATIRKDGGVNIFHAYISGDLPKDYDTMNHWFGPCWNASEKYTLWQVGSESEIPGRAAGYRKPDPGKTCRRVPEVAGAVYQGIGRKDPCAYAEGQGVRDAVHPVCRRSLRILLSEKPGGQRQAEAAGRGTEKGPVHAADASLKILPDRGTGRSRFLFAVPVTCCPAGMELLPGPEL